MSKQKRTPPHLFDAESRLPFEVSRREAEVSNAVLESRNRKLDELARKVGRDICEQTQQTVALVHLELDKLEHSRSVDVRRELTRILELLEQIDCQLAGFSQELWPSRILDHLGLAAAY